MTENEFTLLASLEPATGEPERWVTPRQVGGSDASQHGMILRRMVAKGWAAKRQRGGGEIRPTFEYRATEAGLQALYNARTLRR